MGLSGNLKDRSVPELLRSFERQATSGVVRLRMGTPQGVQRAEFVLHEGKVLGAAIYRAGGARGMGDALVDEALCSPEDAAAATEFAVQVRQPMKGALAEGARRVGVPYPNVVSALTEHILGVARQVWSWQAGQWELVLEGFPEQAERDSAAARAFLLDEGLEVARLGSFPGTGSHRIPAPSPPPAAVDAPSPVDAPPSPAGNLQEFDPFAEPVAAPRLAEPPPEAPTPSGPIAALPVTPEGTESDEPTDPNLQKVAPSREDREVPEGDRKPDADPLPEPEEVPGEDSAQSEASAPPEGSDAPEEGEPSVTDLSTPGLGEAALMEAEQLLDGDVLKVMLEMGSSAAAVAGPDKVATGHLVLVDDGGTLVSSIAPPLREAGFVVHHLSGFSAARERLTDIAEEGQCPLVICDLLLPKPEGDGLMGGLDLAAHAAQLTPILPLILLTESPSPDLDSRAAAAGASLVLLRPLKGELKKDPTKREAFLSTLFEAIDQHRPVAEWTGGESSSAEVSTPWNGKDPEEWDVEGIERQSRVVDDLPDLPLDARARQEALWRETVHQFSGPVSRTEILLAILRFGAEVLSRGVLFTPSRDGKQLVGFGQFGVELAPGVDPDQAVRQIRIPLEGHPGVTHALEARGAVQIAPGPSHWELYLLEALGGKHPVESFYGPVLCQGKVAAVLYGDAFEEQAPIPDTTSLEVVLTQAGLALDRIALEERVRALEEQEAGGGRRPRGAGS